MHANDLFTETAWSYDRPVQCSGTQQIEIVAQPFFSSSVAQVVKILPAFMRPEDLLCW
jgi:hypothetical protein